MISAVDIVKLVKEMKCVLRGVEKNEDGKLKIIGYKCRKCGDEFAEKKLLMRHILGEELMLHRRCLDCGKIFLPSGNEALSTDFQISE